MIITRGIPDELLSRLGTELMISGGTIRVAPGFDKAGSIVRHLRFPENAQAASQVMEQLKATAEQNQQALGAIGKTVSQNQGLLQNIQSMQHATMVMQGMNLAVTVAGFAIVINQLNKISRKLDQVIRQLDQMDIKLDTLLLTANEIKSYQESVQFSRFTANLESLNEALRLEKLVMADQAIITLRESEHQFKLLCERQLQEVKVVYKNPEPFQINFMGAMGASMCIANARAQMGDLKEAENIIANINDWQSSIKTAVLLPLEKKNAPVWLGRLNDQKQSAAKKVVNTQQAVPETLQYLSDTYQLCRQSGRELKSLLAEDQDKLLVIEP
ncbi:hypothetical protein [Endozoicomonas sp.]|uniref:hypothetical protein n=1 Tax=Endozoicomonas sp. TaxID=1892382 RepID=UPI003839FF35